MKRFENKVALVTGGRSGIGGATAKRLRDEGATVITAQRGTDSDFPSISVDFADPIATSTVVDQVVAKHGQLDVLINNAGIMQEAYAEDMTLDDWMRTINVNLTAPFLLIKSALSHLRKTKWQFQQRRPICGRRRTKSRLFCLLWSGHMAGSQHRFDHGRLGRIGSDG